MHRLQIPLAWLTASLLCPLTGFSQSKDLELAQHLDAPVHVTYPAYRFQSEEGWQLRAHGPAGQSQLHGRILRLDFSKGAQAFSLIPPDRSLPGHIAELRLRVYGSPRNIPVRMQLRTHFMNFHRGMGMLEGDGHLELVIPAPPDNDWEWFGGENDGKLHGPLRLAEIRFEPPPEPASVDIELEDILVTSWCPASKRCLIHATVDASSQTPQFKFTARALSNDPMPATVRWDLRNWNGDTLHHGTQELLLPSHAATTNLTVPIPTSALTRWKFLEAEFFLDAPGQEVAPAQAAWVAPIDPHGTVALQPDSPFGMGVYLYRYPATEAGLAEMSKAAATAQSAGVKWSREEFQWSRIEPRRGEYHWDFYDKMLATAKKHGIQVYAIVGYWSDWTRPYTPEGIADYVHYLETLVRRYGRDIRHWEIWNEPNIFFWQGPKELYAELLKRSYEAVKAIAPEAEVLGLSTAGIDEEYIRRMLDLDAPFDILTIHPYRKTLHDQAFLDDLRNVSELVRHQNGVPRPVWLTELGWSTYTPHNTLQQAFAPTTLRAQAELIVRCYLLAIGSGVQPRTFWYNFRNDGEDPFYFEHHMGIVDRQFQPKPAYRTYAVLARLLEGLQPVQSLDLSPHIMAWTFTNTNAPAPTDVGSTRRVTALWSPTSDEQVRVPVRGHHVSLLNAVGETTQAQTQDGNVLVPLRRGATVYLLE